jgi:C-5 cytosine-specific DNA methylase
MPRLLDLFCGRWGWSRAFAARGWHCVGIDLVEPSEIPENCVFIKADILGLEWQADGFLCTNDGYNQPVADRFDFIVASSPCEEFSVWGMSHFHPNPKYPEFGIKLFNYTRAICEASGVPYIMENVRPAQKFVGKAENHCGPFYLWGTAVPPLMWQGVTKGIDVGSSKLVKAMTKEEKKIYRAQFPWNQSWSTSAQRGRDTAKAATIPLELSNCVADYATRILEITA